MKKTLLSSVALLGLTAGAFAADLPSRRVAPAPYVAVPVFTWTGFYVGVNAGGAFRDNNNNGDFFVPAGTFAGVGAFTVFNGNGNNNGGDDSGFTGGGQIGYNYQVGQIVFGIEADIQYLDLGNNNNNNFGFGFVAPAGVPAGFVFANQNRGQLDYFGTVRGRLGYAFDRSLLYVTGGFAYGGGDSNNNNNNFFFANGNNNNNDDTRSGYVVGGGLEYAFTNNWTAKIEGLYVSLDRDNNRNNNGFVGTTAGGVPVFAPVGTFTNNNNDRNDDFAVVRVGLNYKFW